MSTLIRNRQIENDDFVYVADDAALPTTGKIIVSLARWQLERAQLSASGLTVGVAIPNTYDVNEIAKELLDGDLIGLEFPSFGDGRAYSQARILRDRFSFTGELRATGAAVVRDQMQSMARIGINAFSLRGDQNPQLCLDAIEDFSLAYQPATDRINWVMSRRRAA